MEIKRAIAALSKTRDVSQRRASVQHFSLPDDRITFDDLGITLIECLEHKSDQPPSKTCVQHSTPIPRGFRSERAPSESHGPPHDDRRTTPAERPGQTLRPTAMTAERNDRTSLKSVILTRSQEGKLMRAIVIATVIGLAAPSYAQVKIITGDAEHIYGPGGEILDGPQLRAKDQRAKSQMRSEQRGVGPVEQQRLSVQQSGPRRTPDSWSRYQPPKSWWNNNNYEPPKSAWSSQ